MKSLLDYLPKEMLSEDEYPGEEAGRINQLKALPQPVSVNGGSYSYSANVLKDPRTWYASDGSEIKLHTLRELGEYLDRGYAEDWDKFMDGYCDAQDLVQYGMIRSKGPRDQEEHETMGMRGESVDVKDMESPREYGIDEKDPEDKPQPRQSVAQITVRLRNLIKQVDDLQRLAGLK